MTFIDEYGLPVYIDEEMIESISFMPFEPIMIIMTKNRTYQLPIHAKVTEYTTNLDSLLTPEIIERLNYDLNSEMFANRLHELEALYKHQEKLKNLRK